MQRSVGRPTLKTAAVAVKANPVGISIQVPGNPGASRRGRALVIPKSPTAVSPEAGPTAPTSASPSPSSDPRASPKRGITFRNNVKGNNGNTRGYKGKLNLTNYLPKNGNNNSTRKLKKETLNNILARRAATNEDIRKEIAGKILLMNAFGDKWSEARYAISQNPILNEEFDSNVAEIIKDISYIPLSLNDFERTIAAYVLDRTINSKIRRILKK